MDIFLIICELPDFQQCCFGLIMVFSPTTLQTESCLLWRGFVKAYYRCRFSSSVWMNSQPRLALAEVREKPTRARGAGRGPSGQAPLPTMCGPVQGSGALCLACPHWSSEIKLMWKGHCSETRLEPREDGAERAGDPSGQPHSQPCEDCDQQLHQTCHVNVTDKVTCDLFIFLFINNLHVVALVWRKTENPFFPYMSPHWSACHSYSSLSNSEHQAFVSLCFVALDEIPFTGVLQAGGCCISKLSLCR